MRRCFVCFKKVGMFEIVVWKIVQGFHRIYSRLIVQPVLKSIIQGVKRSKGWLKVLNIVWSFKHWFDCLMDVVEYETDVCCFKCLIKHTKTFF